MKFQQLEIGQAFEYQGDSYVKSSPWLPVMLKPASKNSYPVMLPLSPQNPP